MTEECQTFEVLSERDGIDASVYAFVPLAVHAEVERLCLPVEGE